MLAPLPPGEDSWILSLGQFGNRVSMTCINARSLGMLPHFAQMKWSRSQSYWELKVDAPGQVGQCPSTVRNGFKRATSSRRQIHDALMRVDRQHFTADDLQRRPLARDVLERH